MRRLGLRARVIAMFATGALILSASMALLSYELTRSSLLDERERAAVRAAYFDATVVHAGLAKQTPDLIGLLRSLDTGANRRAVMLHEGTWFARTADVGITTAVPDSLKDLVASGEPGVQRVRTSAGAVMVVGVPLSSTTAFYEINSLQDLERTLTVLALVLTVVAIGTTVGGAGLGWYATRHVLRPLASVAKAAQEITAGDFSARLDPGADPELARLTSSFNQMVDELSLRLERDRRFAADVSHELRSPLQTLSAAASVLDRRKRHVDERTSIAVDLIVDEVRRFEQLVTDLLELARSDQPPERAPERIVDLVRQVCCSHGLDEEIISIEVDPDLRWRLDRRRFEQALGNLLDNAERHGGGACHVRLGGGGAVCFVDVEDDGPGVHPRERTAIFDRFVRGRSASARGTSDGTGLGLALVAEHIKAHGGRVFVTDRPGGGASFRMELPR